MTSWKEERDRLVAQTLAFVQQVAAAHPAAANKLGFRSAQDQAPSDVDIIALQPEATDMQPVSADPFAADILPPEVQADEPAAPGNILADLPHYKSRYSTASERSEISDRVAAFKARQMTLNQEREAFYDHMQARIRSALRNDPGKGPL